MRRWSCRQRGAQRHDDRGGRSSVVRVRARRACVKRARPARWDASGPPVTIGEQAIGHLDRPHGGERKMTARTSTVTKRPRAAHEAIRRSNSGRRSGYLMPTEGRDDQKVRTNEIRTVPAPPDDSHSPGFHDDPPHGCAHARRSRTAARFRLIATASMLFPLRPLSGSPDVSASARPRSRRPRPPWTGQGTLASYCLTSTPRFANPF
jgi:hypothetical protein